jgi:hypothetical protein
MTLSQVTIAFSGIGVLVTGALALLYLRDPVAGMAATTHRPEKLPEVMADRYLAFAALAIGATLYGDLKVIAGLFAAFSFMGFADARIYARGGHSCVKHLLAGGAALVVVVLAVLALTAEGEGI